MFKRKILTYALMFFLGMILSSVIWTVFEFLSYRNLSMTIGYDYIVYSDISRKVIVKNGLTGYIDFVGENISSAIYFALENEGKNIFIRSGKYNVSSDILLRNIKGLRITSDGAELWLNGRSLILQGEGYEQSMNNYIEGLKIFNGSMIVENSFMTTIRRCIFKNSDVGIVFLNSNTWTECTLIEDCYFENVKRCIVFKTPVMNGTESYANSEIRHCNFKLLGEGSVAIHIEPRANFNEGLIQNVRIWLGNTNETNQVGILIEGSMLNTVLNNVVFESFAETPQGIYGIKIGEFAEPPILGLGVVFLGNFTKGIDNPFNKWIYGIGSCFKFENIDVPIGLGNNYGDFCEVTPPKYLHFSISTLHLKVKIEGDFAENEVVTLRLRLKFVDCSYSREVTKEFTKSVSSNVTVWLDNDEMFSMWPTVNLISSIVLDAKTNMSSSNVKIYVSVYGQFN